MTDHATQQRQAFIRATANQVEHMNLMERLTMETRRFRALCYLRERGIYILDQGSLKPAWGNGLREAARTLARYPVQEVRP